MCAAECAVKGVSLGLLLNLLIKRVRLNLLIKSCLLLVCAITTILLLCVRLKSSVRLRTCVRLSKNLCAVIPCVR